MSILEEINSMFNRQKIFITIEFDKDYDLYLGKVLREDGYLLYKRFSNSFDLCLKDLGFDDPENNLTKLSSILYSQYEIIYFDKNKFKNSNQQDGIAIEYYFAVLRQGMRSGINKISKS